MHRFMHNFRKACPHPTSLRSATYPQGKAAINLELVWLTKRGRGRYNENKRFTHQEVRRKKYEKKHMLFSGNVDPVIPYSL